VEDRELLHLTTDYAADFLGALDERPVRADGTCWLGGTTWNGEHALRISVSNWRTTRIDVECSAAAILQAATVPA
jgi:hypothetical protein